MTTKETTVTCPNCERPISHEQLAVKGLCDDCLAEVVEQLPPPHETEPTKEPTTSEPVAPISARADDGGAGAPASDEPDTLTEALSLIMGVVMGAEHVRANIWQIDGDDVCNAIGAWCDVVVGVGRETLEMLGVEQPELPEEA